MRRCSRTGTPLPALASLWGVLGHADPLLPPRVPVGWTERPVLPARRAGARIRASNLQRKRMLCVCDVRRSFLVLLLLREADLVLWTSVRTLHQVVNVWCWELSVFLALQQQERCISEIFREITYLWSFLLEIFLRGSNTKKKGFMSRGGKYLNQELTHLLSHLLIILLREGRGRWGGEGLMRPSTLKASRGEKTCRPSQRGGGSADLP